MSPESARSFQLLTLEELEALPDLEWLVKGILPKPSLAVLYGDPGCGKTFVALSMALAAASGGELLGCSCSATDVLYIAAEGVLGLKARTAAYRELQGPVRGDIRFMSSAPNLLDPSDLDVLDRTLEAADFWPGLIVVDTLARVTTGADENNARDMGAAVAALDALKKFFNASVLVIHHKTKSGGSERGSSALRGAADVMIECKQIEAVEGPAVQLECTKMKDDEPFKTIAAAMKKVELPGGKSSLVVSHPVEPQSLSGSLAKGQILAILKQDFGADGATNGELWKAFEAAGYGSKSTFDRGMRAVKDSREVRVAGEGRGKRYFPVSVSVSSVSD